MASADFNNYHGPPPGQGHYPSYPASDRYDDRDRGPSRRSPPRSREPYFDPPPSHERDYAQSEEYSPGPYDRPPPAHQQFADYGASPPPNRPYSDRDSSRPYAPTEPGPHEYNQMAPYNEDKAEAEWNRGVNDAYTYQQRPNRRREYDDRTDDRSLDDQSYDDRDYYDNRGRDDRERRKRRDEEVMKEKALRYPSDPKKGGRDFFGASEGERGFGAKLLGAAGGALIAHEVTKGKGGALKTISGALVGALVADVGEKQFEKRKHEKELSASRAHADDPYVVGYPQPGRDMEDVRRTGRDGVTEAEDRPHPRTRSRTRSRTGFRDRIQRSLSRVRSRSVSRRRRVPSEDSYDSESEYSRRR